MGLNKNIIKAIWDKSKPEMQLEDILYSICKDEQPYCNSNCPVYFLNDNKVPNDKAVLYHCNCYLSGAEMRLFVENNKP